MYGYCTGYQHVTCLITGSLLDTNMSRVLLQGTYWIPTFHVSYYRELTGYQHSTCLITGSLLDTNIPRVLLQGAYWIPTFHVSYLGFRFINVLVSV
jgi:hypothetical protein